MSVWALIPVKRLRHAKSRLAGVLQPEECAMLSRAMLMDVLTAMDEAECIEHVAVLTDDMAVAELAEQLGHRVITDKSAGALCAGLNAAAGEIAAAGADTLLVMP